VRGGAEPQPSCKHRNPEAKPRLHSLPLICLNRAVRAKSARHAS
jgi:hypothetical protein